MYSDFLNKTCSIRRYSDSGTTNEYGEQVKDYATIANLVPCRLEKLYDRELVENCPGGDHDKRIFCVYFEMGVNIRSGDVLIIDGEVPDWLYLTDGENNDITVMNVDDAGGGKGHHLEVWCRYRKGIE